MADQSPNLESVFLSALEIDSPQERAIYLDQACGHDQTLRAEVEKMLAAQRKVGSFLESPLSEFDATIVPGAAHKDLAASLDAGLAPAFGADDAVVLGDAGHSVLRSLANTLNEVPRVALRESEAEGPDPITRPSSPEIPKSNSDSRYQLQGEIARGGMGAIIKGRDTDLGRDLAIKVLLDSHKNKPEVIQRFVEEAQIGGQLQHPGIAPIYELGQFVDKRPFFAMKLVKGETLSKLLAQRKEPAEERGRFLGIFEQICQTMAYAHSRGVIHRDLKPANIMVGAFGEVQVMDWGLAKVLPAGGVADEKKAYDKQQGQSVIQTLRSQPGSDAPGTFGTLGSQTQMGSVMGTPAYMPPEQALGEIDNLDERADVFGLGAILCEILTGKPPYVAEDGTRVFRMASRGKLDDAFSRLNASRADEDLIALTKHCLELEPVDRPRDAGVLAERVTEYLESVETRLREAEVERAAQAARADAEAAQADAERQRAEAESQRAEAQAAKAEAESARANEESKRRRTSLALAASVLLLVAVGSGGWLYMLRQEANRQTAEAIAQRQHAAEMQALAEQRDDQRKLAEQETSKAEAASRQAETEKLHSLNMLADMQTERGLQASRDGQAAVAALWFANAAALTPHDPDRLLANHRRAESWSHQTMMPVALLKLPKEYCKRFAFQRDGVLALTLSSDRLRVWDWRNEVVLPWCERSGLMADAAWSADGKLLAVCTTAGEVQLLDPASGAVGRRFANSERADVLAWSPDGTRLVAAGNHVIVWNIAAEPFIESDWPHPNKVWGVNFNRSGTQLVTACEDNLARVFAINDPTRPAPLFAPVEHVNPSSATPAFCDSDRKLVTFLKTGYPTLRDAENGTITDPGWKLPYGANRGLDVSPDGRWIAIAGFHEGMLLSVEGRSHVLHHGNHVDTTAFHPNGQTVLTTCFDGTARQWPLLDLEGPTALIGAPIESPQLATYGHAIYSPDGSCFAIETGSQVTIWEQLQSSCLAGTIAWNRLLCVARVSEDGRLAVPGVWHSVPFGRRANGDRLTVARVSDGLPAGPQLALEGLHFDACVCSDNRSVAVVSIKGTEGLLTVFDIAAGTPVFPPITLPALPMSVSVRPGRPQVAVLCQNGVLQVFDTQTGTQQLEGKYEVTTTQYATHARADYSPDGATLVTVTPNSQVLVRDAESGDLRFPALNPVISGGPCRAIAFSSDGGRLATAVNGRNMVQVWDLVTGEKIGAEMPHPGDTYGLFSVEFSPDGTWLLTGHQDGRVRIFDWWTGQLVGAPMQHPGEVHDPRFTADGRHVLTGVRGAPLHVWDVSTRKLAVPQVVLGSTNLVSIAGDRAVVTADSRYFVLDLSMMLQAPSTPLPTLTRQLELATNQKQQLGELVPLDRAEWFARWDELVASRQTPEAAAESLATALDEATSDSARSVVIQRAVRLRVLDRLQSVRPNERQVNLALAMEQVMNIPNPVARLAAAYVLTGDTGRAADLITKLAAEDLAALLETGVPLEGIFDFLQSNHADQYAKFLPGLASAAVERGRLEFARGLYERLIALQPDSSLWKERNSQLQKGVLAVWNFDNDLREKWPVHDCELSVKDGVLTMRRTGSDPYFYTSANGPAGGNAIVLRYRADEAFNLQIFWDDATGGFSENQSRHYPIPASPGEWREVTLPFWSQKTLKHLRLDPDTAEEHPLEIDSLVLRSLDPTEAAELGLQLIQANPNADWSRAVDSQPNLAQTAFDNFRLAQRWSEATVFGSLLLKQNPEDSVLWVMIPPIIALADDDAAYRNFCQVVVENYRKHPTGEAAEKAIKGCLLRPGAIYVAELPGDLLAQSLNDGTLPEGIRSWGWFSLALLAYRSGDAETAVKHVTQSEQLNPADEHNHAMNFAVLALAQHQLKHPDEARKALDEASQVIQRRQAIDRNHHDLLIAEILFHEAEAVIIGKTKP